MQLLVIEDSPLDYEMVVATLALQGQPVQARRVDSASGLRAALKSQRWDAIISDHHLPGFSSGEAYEIVRSQAEPPPFLIVSGMIGEDSAVEAMRRGVDDYLIKGRLARLGMAVRNAVAAATVRREKAAAQEMLRGSQQQLRNLSAALQTRIDEERGAMAREIHDEIGGALTAIRFDLELLDRQADEAARARIRRALEVLGQAAQATQRVIRDLRPPILDAGLVAALEWQVKQFRERLALQADFRCNLRDVAVDAAVAMTLYRACQEALTNISKHAQATTVCVDLHAGGGTLSLEVTDDGRGLAAGDLAKPGALGLRGLTERANAVGGAVEVSSAQGRTTLMLWIPLAGPEAGAALEGHA